MIFLCGMHFALRSGQEHRTLKISQFELVKPASEPPYIIYYENFYIIYYEKFSKNNSEGLSSRKVKPKQVIHHSNMKNPSRCLVNLYQKYLEHRPDVKETSFYLTPLKKPKSTVWYTKIPVGHNTLSKTVSRLCKAGEILGYKTNHSLQVTTATHLFQSGIDEQLIMSRTGHQSIDGVWKYKRIGNEQMEATSEVLNSATNGEPFSVVKKSKLSNEENDDSCTSVGV